MSEPLPHFDEERWREMIRGKVAERRAQQVLGTLLTLLSNLPADLATMGAEAVRNLLATDAQDRRMLAGLLGGHLPEPYAQRIAELCAEEFDESDARIEALLAPFSTPEKGQQH